MAWAGHGSVYSMIRANMGKQDIQSTLSKTDTFGTGTICPSWRDERLKGSQIEGAKKGRHQL